MKSLTLFAALLIASNANAEHHKESYYQKLWCDAHGGRTTGIGLPTGLQPDCETDEFIVEFDFAHKYREGIIQVLEYQNESGKKGLLVLIVEIPSDDNQYVHRMLNVRRAYNMPFEYEIMEP